MIYARRVQERLIHNNQSSEKPLGMQLSNENERRIKETNVHEKKDKIKKEHRKKIAEIIECVKKHVLHMP